MTRRRLLLIPALCATGLLAACGGPPSDRGAGGGAGHAIDPAGQQSAVRDLVARFGARMQTVSLLAPDSIRSAQLREAYGALVTPELLADWVAHPDRAPGRRVSSPWPDSIAVQAVREVGAGELEVTGTVLYVTSVERTHGGSAASEPVRLRVRRTADSSWRISAYAEGGLPSGG